MKPQPHDVRRAKHLMRTSAPKVNPIQWWAVQTPIEHMTVFYCMGRGLDKMRHTRHRNRANRK